MSENSERAAPARGVTDHAVLGAVLDHADRGPDGPAVTDLDRALTRGELCAAAGREAAGLLQKGVEPGGRVTPDVDD